MGRTKKAMVFSAAPSGAEINICPVNPQFHRGLLSGRCSAARV
jgi:hypothetical protein